MGFDERTRHSRHATAGVRHSRHATAGVRHSRHATPGVRHSRRATAGVRHSRRATAGVRHSRRATPGVRHSRHATPGVGHSRHVTAGVRHSRHATAGVRHLRRVARPLGTQMATRLFPHSQCIGSRNWLADRGLGIAGSRLPRDQHEANRHGSCARPGSAMRCARPHPRVREARLPLFFACITTSRHP